jgi:cytoskeletal protein CcmA (bactofilin family)
MENETRQDLTIAGSASAPGGTYKDARISGAGKITSDLDCVRFEVSGAATVSGSVKAESVRISGATKIEGDLESGEARVSGSIEVQGGVTAKELKVDGSASIGGGISAEKAEIRGALKAKGDCNADDFVSKGSFAIDGLLNAENIDISLYGNSHAREIGGGTIHVCVEKNAFLGLHAVIHALFSHADSLTAESIEGDEIHLEHTKAKVVRGNNVTLGPGCEIGLVEYKTGFDKADDAKVTESRQA